jgi:hypothetical protein
MIRRIGREYLATQATRAGQCLAILLMLALPSLLHGQTIGRPKTASSFSDLIAPSPPIRLPVQGGTAVGPGGITCSVAFGQEFTTGYVATAIRLQAQGKFTTDRDLVFQFRGVDQSVFPPNRNLIVDVPISVQQGTSSQSTVRYLPRWAITREVAIDVFEDGRAIPDFDVKYVLPADVRLGPGNQATNFSGLRYASVALRDELLFDPLVVINADRPNEMEAKLSDTLISVIQTPITMQPLANLPTDWRAYQRFDAIVLSQSLSDRLAEKPESLEAVRQWLMMGGTVIAIDINDPSLMMSSIGLSTLSDPLPQQQLVNVVAGLNSQWSQLYSSTLNQLSVLQEIADSDPAKDAPPVTYSNFRNAERYAGDPDLSLAENVKRAEGHLASLQQAQTRTEQQWNDRIWIRSAAAGQIIGLSAVSDNGVIEETDWDVIGRLISFRVSPMLRRGVDPMIGDSRFRDWLIPGVAQPPVYTFIGLLTAFVILVGPVAYRQTTRHHRSHLMFLIAPALAIITTVMMFAYGILSDGFGTLVRVRQLTMVDGVSETGVERIRSTYFAGVRPTDGLRFGGADEVMAYPESQQISWTDQLQRTPQTIGRITIDENYQRMDASFLPSRRQTQFVVHRPRPSIGSLRLQTNDKQHVMVTNGFEFPLRRIVIRGKAEQYWAVDSIESQAKVSARAVDGKVFSKMLGGLYNDFRPLMSSVSQGNSYRGSGRTFDLLREVARQVAPQQAVYDGSIEMKLRDQLQSRLEIPAGHFIGISDISDDVVAVDDAEQIGCVRYVMGTFVIEESL